ncbi:hypothetical protein L1987_18419 [Smallanthus sonchifolius]|uniref:Uncharacterized protein n=1 Tax=Smallanthus sonchifolius TaxID=185202 RepID=A0ACB9J089_9ASTR|nr:hypothetical protein L1987_18419 [Smallanthus sonchifolius]
MLLCTALNDTINKLSADDEEKEKEVETETVKGDRKRKRGDKEEKEQEKEKRKRDISKLHTNEVVTNETSQGEGGEDREKKEEKGNEKKPAQENRKSPKGYLESCRPADKTSGSKPFVSASTSSVLPGLQTVGKDEKPAKGKGREGNEEISSQVKKVNEHKVVEDDAGKTAQAGGFETPAPKSKDDSEVPVNVKKVNEDDDGKTTQDGEDIRISKCNGYNYSKNLYGIFSSK